MRLLINFYREKTGHTSSSPSSPSSVIISSISSSSPPHTEGTTDGAEKKRFSGLSPTFPKPLLIARYDGDMIAGDSESNFGCSRGMLLSTGCFLLDLGVLCFEGGVMAESLGGVAFGVVGTLRMALGDQVVLLLTTALGLDGVPFGVDVVRLIEGDSSSVDFDFCTEGEAVTFDAAELTRMREGVVVVFELEGLTGLAPGLEVLVKGEASDVVRTTDRLVDTIEGVARGRGSEPTLARGLPIAEGVGELDVLLLLLIVGKVCGGADSLLVPPRVELGDGMPVDARLSLVTSLL